jgi:hypothetical protein
MRHQARLRLNAEQLGLAGVGNSDAHVLEGIGTGYTMFPGTTFAEYRAALEAGAVEPRGEHWSTGHNVTVYLRQLRAKGRHLRHAILPGGEWR